MTRKDKHKSHIKYPLNEILVFYGGFFLKKHLYRHLITIQIQAFFVKGGFFLQKFFKSFFYNIVSYFFTISEEV